MRFIFKTDYAQDLQIVKHSGQAFWYGLLVLAMLAAPLWAGDYWLSQISFVLIYAVAGLGLMVLSGFTGLAPSAMPPSWAWVPMCRRCCLPRAGRFR